MRILTHTVAAGEDGLTVRQLLRSLWHMAHTGDLLCADVSDPPGENPHIQPVDFPLDVLYEDDDLLLVNKPAGMVAHPGHGNYSATLVNALTYHLQNLPLFQEGDMRAGLVHRIDKNTSGLLVIAKDEQTHARLAKAPLPATSAVAPKTGRRCGSSKTARTASTP